MKKFISIVFITVLFASCEKVVDLKYRENQSKIIIEGNITDAPGPYYVRISKSVALANTENYPTINNATVTIGDDAGNTETLTSLGNGVYQTNRLVGTPGRTYKLNVLAENQTYSAQSTMPLKVPFESLKVDASIITGETEYSLIPVYTDPLATGNNYGFVIWQNDTLIKQRLVQNDIIRNGITNTVRLEINDNNLTFKTGDIITMQMQCVDKNVAAYYSTLALMNDSGPGGGTTPNNPPNNISNGALGLFSAHTAETRTVTLP